MRTRLAAPRAGGWRCGHWPGAAPPAPQSAECSRSWPWRSSARRRLKSPNSTECCNAPQTGCTWSPRDATSSTASRRNANISSSCCSAPSPAHVDGSSGSDCNSARRLLSLFLRSPSAPSGGRSSTKQAMHSWSRSPKEARNSCNSCSSCCSCCSCCCSSCGCCGCCRAVFKRRRPGPAVSCCRCSPWEGPPRGGAGAASQSTSPPWLPPKGSTGPPRASATSPAACPGWPPPATRRLAVICCSRVASCRDLPRASLFFRRRA
mmetsp:Transcript_81474/g.256922  ORF Transcript_81474/g.256922 Transcript_81474/m.256922 type:complete len:263 (+) Transcript_81474:956-1744(+)